MRTVTEFPHPVEDRPHILIPMPDGTRLAARLWLPRGAGRVPCILEAIPYRKRDGTAARDARMHPWFAGHGYAALRLDLRGSGDSEGVLTDEYTAEELADCCAAIGWAAAQDWCDGSVGMMGKSWGGFNCLMTAALRPPALRAVIAVCATTDRFADDIHFKGGCLLGANAGWGAVMLSYSSRPADPVLRPDWRADWLARLAADVPLAPRWAGHQARDRYWRHGSVCEDWGAISVPVLAVGGWADGYRNTPAALVANLPGVAQGIVGPWVHQYPHEAVPGPAAGFLQIARRWWDRWLRGIPNGAEADPAMRLYVQESAPPDPCTPHRAGRWIAERVWPSPRVAAEPLALSPGGRLGGAGGRLNARVATPQDLGLLAGEYFPMGLAGEMPGDQRDDDARSVCFDALPEASARDLIGRAVLHLRITCDRPRAFLVARLCDVAPNGASARIAHGMLNLCHREGMDRPSPVPVGEAFDIAIPLDQMAHRIAAGHRLRLALSTTYWPFLWPAPEAAAVTVLAGRLDLPVAQGDAPTATLPEPEAAPPWPHRVLTPERDARRIERDLIAGTVTLVVEHDSGDREDAAHGLVTGSAMTQRWTIRPDDPLSVAVAIVWDQRLSRGDWSVRTRAVTRMHGTRTTLVIGSRLTAWEGAAQVFDREDRHAVPRDFV
jgi:putative CocE/NonD family hydrolase